MTILYYFRGGAHIDRSKTDEEAAFDGSFDVHRTFRLGHSSQICWQKSPSKIYWRNWLRTLSEVTLSEGLISLITMPCRDESSPYLQPSIACINICQMQSINSPETKLDAQGPPRHVVQVGGINADVSLNCGSVTRRQ